MKDPSNPDKSQDQKQTNASPVAKQFERIVPEPDEQPNPFLPENDLVDHSGEPGAALYTGLANDVASDAEKQQWDNWQREHPEASETLKAFSSSTEDVGPELEALFQRGKTVLDDLEPLPDEFWHHVDAPAPPKPAPAEAAPAEKAPAKAAHSRGTLSWWLAPFSIASALSALAVALFLLPPSPTPNVMAKSPLTLEAQMFVKRDNGEPTSVQNEWVVRAKDGAKFRILLKSEKSKTAYYSIYLVNHKGTVDQIAQSTIPSGGTHILPRNKGEDFELSPPAKLERIYICGDHRKVSLQAFRDYIQSRLKKTTLDELRTVPTELCLNSKTWLLKR